VRSWFDEFSLSVVDATSSLVSSMHNGLLTKSVFERQSRMIRDADEQSERERVIMDTRLGQPLGIRRAQRRDPVAFVMLLQ
jgi:hypothetical protein